MRPASGPLGELVAFADDDDFLAAAGTLRTIPRNKISVTLSRTHRAHTG